MPDDYYGWSCPIKQLKKCNVSMKEIESPIYYRTNKSNNLAKLQKSKRYNASLWQNTVPEKRDGILSCLQDLDQKTITTQKSVKFKNLKTTTTRNFRSPSPNISNYKKCKFRSPSPNISKHKIRKLRSPSPNICKCKIPKLSRNTNQCIQTERQGVFSHFTSMVDGIGTAVVDNAPWIPYVSATALAIVLFGFFSKKVEKALSIYNTANELLSKFPLNDIPLVREERDVQESPIPETPCTNCGTVNPRHYYIKRSDNVEESPISAPPPTASPKSLKFHYNKLKWPQEPLTRKDLSLFKKGIHLINQ